LQRLPGQLRLRNPRGSYRLELRGINALFLRHHFIGNLSGRNRTMLPPIRSEWVKKRTGPIVTQMRYARQGMVTEEMEFVAKRERLSPELVRSEVARGRMIIPANIRHVELEPMCIGVASKCKINANIGNSATTSNLEEELEKLRASVKYGADTVMDLSTGGGIHEIRGANLRNSPRPVRTVPIYEAVTRLRQNRYLTPEPLLQGIE